MDVNGSMVSDATLIRFTNREVMAARLADLIETTVMSGPVAGGHGEIAVSGGSTPRALYETLAARPLPWKRVRVTLVDERWVAIDHLRSNEAFVKGAFAAADGVSVNGLYNGAASPTEGLAAIAASLGGRQKPFDVVVLGMGDDGHTASWFPHAKGLDTALSSDELVCAVTAKKSAVTGEEIERMTLTLSAIKDARVIVLMIAGEEKRAAFERASAPGPVEDMPVRAILRARPDMWVCWAP